MKSKQQLGAAGEARARRLLEAKRYQFVAANARTRFGEIDLVMRDGEFLVFVEVKTRRGFGQGTPEEAVNYWKLRHTIRAAEQYCREWKHRGPWRIDVVAIDQNGVRHVENVTQ